MSDLEFWQDEIQNNPDDPYTLAVYAYHLQADQQSKRALEVIDKALQIDPEYNKALVLKGAILLSLGDYTNGWPLHELWHNNHYPETYKMMLNCFWDGKPTSNLVVLWDDQGFGDCIQFLRYIPEVRERCPKLMVTVKPELEELVRLSFPGLSFFPYRVEAKVTYVECDPRDQPTLKQAPFTSLGSILKTTLDTIPNKMPYLHAAPRYGGGGIGVCWHSGNEWENVNIKSIPHQTIKPLIDAIGARSLQKEDLRVNNFAETAAIIDNLDLVITVDTAVAHLAGALGKPTWVLLAKDCDWRWLQNRTDSPWYPTARLFRQKEAGDWQGVIEDVKKALDNLR